MIDAIRGLMNQAEFAPWQLFNMLIDSAFVLIVGLILGWFAHKWAGKSERQNQKQAELLYWREQLSQIEKDLRAADRPTGAFGLLRRDIDDDGTVKWTVPMERERIIEGRKVIKKIQELEADLAKSQTKRWWQWK